jgi:glutamyl-tRNA synthetase
VQYTVEDKPFAVRQKVEKGIMTEYEDLVYGKIAINTDDIEEGVLLKSDGMPTYNFANVIDDHLMNITHVIRGSEYLSSTSKYNLIYDAFGWERPKYIHLPPIMKDKERKLSKRYGDANYDDFIKKGYLPEAIINYIALLGWSPKDNTEKMSMSELIERFDTNGLSKSPAIFDEAKCKYINSLYLREMPFEKFQEMVMPFLDNSTLYTVHCTLNKEVATKLVYGRAEILSDAERLLAFLNEFDPTNFAAFNNEKWKTNKEIAEKITKSAIKTLENGQTFEDAVNGEIEKGYKKGQVLWCLRIAMTAVEVTAGGAGEIYQLLGKNEALRRMKAWDF